jgi:hypothetical protein
MSIAIQARAEVEKLARALGAHPDDLGDLADAHPHDIRGLRHAVTDSLYEADRHHFARVAAVAKAVPVALAAKLAEHALGPLLAARVAGLVDTDLACNLARRLPPDFLAHIAVQLDPRQATAILSCLPADLVAAGARELDERGEHVAMSMFVGHLSDGTLHATVDVLSDEALLTVGFLIEAPERLDAVFAALPDERIEAIIALAAEQDRWDELEGIHEHLGPQQRARAERLRDAA